MKQVKQLALICTLSVVISLVTATAQAMSLQNATGLTGVFTTETFDTSGAVAGSLAASQFSGLFFDTNLYVNPDYGGKIPNMLGNSLGNFYDPYGNCCMSSTSFSFSSVVSNVAFAFASNPGTSTFSAYLGQTLVESFSAATGYDGSFYGFTGIAFDSIKIDSGGSNGAYLMDNLQFVSVSAVPEPEAYAMLLVGLCLIGFIAARRSSQNSTMTFA